MRAVELQIHSNVQYSITSDHTGALVNTTQKHTKTHTRPYHTEEHCQIPSKNVIKIGSDFAQLKSHHKNWIFIPHTTSSFIENDLMQVSHSCREAPLVPTDLLVWKVAFFAMLKISVCNADQKLFAVFTWRFKPNKHILSEPNLIFPVP